MSVQALREFLDRTVAGGILLLAAAVGALIWSNSPWAASYHALWEGTPLTLGLGQASLTLSLQDWINDALMALFFLVVGLEIKRELLVGELASPRRAALPVAAAAGGAILPALIFLAIVGPGSPEARGWGVPMATDIAFALGVLALLGDRVPIGLRVFVAALAIADDLLAVLVIAFFYTSELSLPALAAAAAIVVVLLIANRLGVRHLLVYGALGICLWLAVFASGVHATIAGVLLAMTIPVRGSGAPALRIEHALTPIVAFAIVPLFALANAGVTIAGDLAELVSSPVAVGVALGLIIGKQVGITATAWLMVRLRLATLPQGVTWAHIYGAAWACGIGFTMSLFIANLAFGDSIALAESKIGILVASTLAGGVGYVLLRRLAPRMPA